MANKTENQKAWLFVLPVVVLVAFNALTAPLGKSAPSAATYYGDTPQYARKKLRTAARVIISNPDMLHSGSLPRHPRWRKFFANLRYNVIDDRHTYRGLI